MRLTYSHRILSSTPDRRSHTPLSKLADGCLLSVSFASRNQVSQLKENLLARGLSSDGNPNDLVGRLLEAVPLPCTSAQATAGGAPASPGARGVKRGCSAVHRDPLADRRNLAEGAPTPEVDAVLPCGVDEEGPSSNGEAKRMKRS